MIWSALSKRTKPPKSYKAWKGLKGTEFAGDGAAAKGKIGANGANVSSTADKATNKDVLEVLAALNSNVDIRFCEINSFLSGIRATFAEINTCLTSTEEATQSHEKWSKI